MKVVLELQDQPSNIKKVTVRHDIVIGRGADCNLRLSAPQVSRRHCFLRVNGDGASLTDLDSSNGTWMNGKKLSSSKRYNIEDGAMLAVGPVKFVARVLSEVAAGEKLEVQLQDDRIEAELSMPADGLSGDMDAEATVSDLMPDDDHSNMDFALEQGGVAAAEDDPTTDYVATDSADGSSFNGVADIDAPDVVDDDDEILDALPADDPDVAAADVIEADEVVVMDHDDDLVEVVDDVVEVVDDDVEVIGDDEILVVDDDQVVLADEEEVLVVEDDEIVEVAEEPAAAAPQDDSADEASELRDFLKGLD